MLNTVLSSRTPADGLSNWRAANTPASSSMTTSEPTAMDSVAAHFQREASRLLNASDLVADPTSMTLIQQALGIKMDAGASRASQADLISSMINFHDFQIPSKIQQFIELYTTHAASPSQSVTGAESPSHGILPQHAPPVSDQVLQSLQTLRVGGV